MMSSFLGLFGKKEESPQEPDEEFEKYMDALIDDTDLFPESYYNDLEKKLKIKYSKRFIVAMYKKYFEGEIKFEDYSNKDGLDFKYHKGSMYAKNFGMYKIIYTIPKEKLPVNMPLKCIEEKFFMAKDRLNHDADMKVCRVVEGDESKVSVIQEVMKSPIPKMVSERQNILKKVVFELGDKIFQFSSSVNDDFFKDKETEGCTKLFTFFCVRVYSKDDKNYYIRTITSCDMRVNLPDSFTLPFVPKGFKNLYTASINKLNEEYKEGSFKFE